MRSREDWEQWYVHPDPWRSEGSDDELLQRYPHIEFRRGDLLDVVRQPEVIGTPFDLVVVAEVLYYLQFDVERREAIAGVARIGIPDCLYYFSVIVTGASAGRRYFTHDEFVGMLSEKFRIIEHFPTGVQFSAIVDHTLHAMPFRNARLRWRKRLIEKSDSARWKHIGYFARKRGTSNSQSTD